MRVARACNVRTYQAASREEEARKHGRLRYFYTREIYGFDKNTCAIIISYALNYLIYLARPPVYHNLSTYIAACSHAISCCVIQCYVMLLIDAFLLLPLDIMMLR